MQSVTPFARAAEVAYFSRYHYTPPAHGER